MNRLYNEQLVICLYGDGLLYTTFITLACLAGRGRSVEDPFLPESLNKDGFCYPAPIYSNRDRYEILHIRDIGVDEIGETSQMKPDLSCSGLGSEILSQTESESDTSSSELVEVIGIETQNENEREDINNSIIAQVKSVNDNYVSQLHSDIKFRDSASIMNKLSLAQELKMAEENIMVEDDLIEFENVNVHPDFDEGISVSPGSSDNDQNNQNTRLVDKIRNTLENKSQSDMSDDLKYILDDLDSHLNLSDNNAKEVSQSCLESLDRSHDRSHDTPSQTDYVIDYDSVSPSSLLSSRPFTLPVPSFPKLAQKPIVKQGQVLPNNHLRLIGEHKTPPYEGEFSHAVDSIYVTRKRSLHSTEKHSDVTPESTPLRPLSYGEAREQTATADDNKRKASRKSVTFSPVNDTAVGSKSEGSLPKCGVSSLSSATPRTYFATLEKSGHLSPFIKSIAKKYGLFNTPASPNQESHEESFDSNDLELDVSYASTLLGKSDEFDDSTGNFELNSFTSLEKQKTEIETSFSRENHSELENVSDTAQSMINNYLYDVLQSDGNKPMADQESEVQKYIMDSCIDQFVDNIISKSYAAVELQASEAFEENKASSKNNVSAPVIKSSQGDAEDHDSELSDLEFYSDSVLLCITQGPDDDSPPLSNCSPSLYPLRIEPEAPHSSVKKSESAVITGNEKECHWFSRNQVMSQDDQLFKPVEKPQVSKMYRWNKTSNDENNNILSYMMNTCATEPKLPSSHSVCQTSSYCRIPFGSGEAPSFWFKKDFKESPKEKKEKRKIEIKVKSPGKRSFTSFCETSGKEFLHQVPSLAKLAEKVHQEYFRQRLDAIGRRFNNELNDYTTCQSCVESSPAKKRRRKQERSYKYKINVNNSSLSPVEEGSVEVYFTSLLDHTPDHDDHTTLTEPRSTTSYQLNRAEDVSSAKVDWSRRLFGSKSDTEAERLPDNLQLQQSRYEKGFKPFVRHSVSTQCQSEGSPFVSPFKRDRHFRQRPVECMGSDPFVDDLSERRQKRNLWPKIRNNEEAEPVILTRFRRLNSKGEEALAIKSDDLEELEISYGKRPACNHVHTCTQRLVSPGNFHISASELDDEPPLLSDFSEERPDHAVEGSYTRGMVSHRDVSTMTNFSENDLCNTSDLSENLSYEATFGSRSDRSHSWCARDSDTSATTESDEGHSFSMFYRLDNVDVDDNHSKVNRSDVGGTPDRKGESLTMETSTDRQWDTVSTDSAVIVEKKMDKLEQAVKSHLSTSSDAESDVLDIMKTRKSMYEAISDVMESCSSAMDYSKGAVVKSTEDTECVEEVIYESDGLAEDVKNDWDVSPDPDALLKDFEEIDLTDTPQYVATEGNNEEIKQFLDDVLQPFDDIFADSFSSLGLKESPIHRTSTKNTDLQQKMGPLDISSRDSTIAGDQTNEENILNRSFLDEDQSGNTSVGTPLKFGHENASSTPIDEPCSPACMPNHGFEIKGEMNKASDDDESFMSARSSRTNQYDYSKNTAESFESYRTGIDRSSILGWLEEDTLNANSDLEGFLQTITENSVERTCFSQNGQPDNEEDPLNRYKIDKQQLGWSEANEERNKENGGGDYLLDLDNIHIDLLSEHGKFQENLTDDKGCSGMYNSNIKMARATDDLPGTAGDKQQDVLCSPGKGSPSEGQSDTLSSKPACFYVGSSDESVHASTGTEV